MRVAKHLRSARLFETIGVVGKRIVGSPRERAAWTTARRCRGRARRPRASGTPGASQRIGRGGAAPRLAVGPCPRRRVPTQSVRESRWPAWQVGAVDPFPGRNVVAITMRSRRRPSLAMCDRVRAGVCLPHGTEHGLGDAGLGDGSHGRDRHAGNGLRQRRWARGRERRRWRRGAVVRTRRHRQHERTAHQRW
jgi:hypothetical protein